MHLESEGIYPRLSGDTQLRCDTVLFLRGYIAPNPPNSLTYTEQILLICFVPGASGQQISTLQRMFVPVTFVITKRARSYHCYYGRETEIRCRARPIDRVMKRVMEITGNCMKAASDLPSITMNPPATGLESEFDDSFNAFEARIHSLQP